MAQSIEDTHMWSPNITLYIKTATSIYNTDYFPMNFMFEFPCIISLYYIKNQQDATLAVLFIRNCKITLHVSDAESDRNM